VGGAGAVVLLVVFGVRIANAIRNKVYHRKMRRHFSDTRGRRRVTLDLGIRLLCLELRA
jgi:hypothetical protein